MKLALLLLSLLLLSGNSQSQTPDYFNNNAAWSGQEYVGPTIAEDFIGWVDDFLYYTDGTETIGAHTYFIIKKRVYRMPGISEEPEDYAEFENSYTFYARQEDRAIYFLHDGLDSLFINYDLEIGDELTGYFGALNPATIVNEIDSVLVGETYRRIFYTELADAIFPETHLIEGIGHFGFETESIGFYFGETQYGNYGGIGFSIDLYCYGKNHISLWGLDECNLTLDISKEKIESTVFNCYPNPTDNNFTISSEKIIKTLTINGVDGKIIQTLAIDSKQAKVNISDFNNGFYFVILNFLDDTEAMQTIIKTGN